MSTFNARSGSWAAGDPSDVEHPSVAAAHELAMELRRRWEGGDPVTAGELLEFRAELQGDAEAALEVVYEEYCQREQAGQHDAEQHILATFPQWASPLRVMIECHRRLLEAERQPPQFPQSGDSIGDFSLLEEIGHGARGRVFLGVQAALADRPVVLKITPLDGAEHLSLARLQHTNIVPLYSILDVAGRNLRVLCMPYFGRATLAAALAAMRQPARSRTGSGLVDAIDLLQEPSAQRPMGGPRRMLEKASYVQAMCWIVACLADALHFAHERGLVHLDLKPSNILLSTDGQPMLLDFHLAHGPLDVGATPPENLGGTPAYMPPEQYDAMRALREGREVTAPVDARADIYALGAILYEALSGQPPAAAGAAPPRFHTTGVSRGLSDIVARCLRPSPQDRYPSAAALADDLRRHLTNRPLAGVPNRSLRERWSKWRARRPSALRAATLVAMLMAALVIVLVATMQNLRQRQRQAQVALRDGQRQLSHGQLSESVESFGRGIALLEGVPLQNQLRRDLERQIEESRRLQLVQRTHELAEQVRRLPGAPAVSAEQLDSLWSNCRALWEARGALMQRDGGPRDAQLESDMRDIAIFAATLRGRMAPGAAAQDRADLLEAIRIIDEVESALGAAAVLDHERRRCQRALGQEVEELPLPRAGTLGGWEHCALGRARLEGGDLRGAAQQLAAARALDPADLWANFYYGLCAYRLGDFEDAVTAFSVCIGAKPDFTDCYYNRGLAYTALGRRQEGLQDYRRALALDPGHPAREAIASLSQANP